MPLVYTSGSGAPGDQFDHPTVNAARTVQLQEVGDGTVLPDGDYVGEPLVWDEAGWAGSSLVRVEQVAAVDSDQALSVTGGSLVQVESNAGGVVLVGDATSTTLGFQLPGGGAFLRFDAAGFLVQDAAALNYLRITTAQWEAAAAVIMTLSASGAGLVLDPSGAELGIAPGQSLRLSVNGVRRVECDDTGLGFFGAPPVGQQSIVGVTTQDQVDSIVAALVALGFVTDDR